MNVCRFCGKCDREDEHGLTLIGYDAQHHAHPDCLLNAEGARAFELLQRWQLQRFPAWAADRAGLLGVLSEKLAYGSAGRAVQTPTSPAPIPMILHCPTCKVQHVDAPDPQSGWTNPPHHSHHCENCGTIWRPADVPTVGVEFIQTVGKQDSLDFRPALPAAPVRIRFEPRTPREALVGLVLRLFDAAIAADEKAATEVIRDVTGGSEVICPEAYPTETLRGLVPRVREIIRVSGYRRECKRVPLRCPGCTGKPCFCEP